MEVNYIEGWLKIIAESKDKKPILPFTVEVVMKDHRSYYLRDVAEWDDKSGTALIKIYDFRGLSKQDKEIVKLKISNIYNRETKPEEIHPYLDWANLRVNIKDIMYCVEWHDRVWPLGVEAVKMLKKMKAQD
ncbi:hypothetical protein ES705_05773 [subsurface metagenome]